MAVAERFVIVAKDGDTYPERTVFYFADNAQDAVSRIMDLVSADDESISAASRTTRWSSMDSGRCSKSSKRWISNEQRDREQA